MNSESSQFVVSCFITFVTSLGFGFFVYTRNILVRCYQQFGLLALSIAWWSFFLALEVIQHESNSALHFSRLMHYGVCFIPIFYMHFVFTLLESSTFKRNLLYVGYLLAFVLSLSNSAGWLVPSVSPKAYFTVYTDPGSFYPFLLLHFTFFPILAVIYIVKEIFQSRSWLKQNQLKIILMASLVGFIPGMSTFLPVYGISTFPFAPLLVSVHVLILVVGILKYRLLDIEVIVKRTIVFAGIVTAAVLAIAIPFGLIQAIIGQALGIPDPFVLRLFGIATTVLIYRPVERFLIHVTDRYLFQKKEDMRVVLNRLAQNIITILDRDKVGDTILSTLKESLRLESGAIMMINRQGTGYAMLASFPTGSPHLFYEKDHPLVQHLSQVMTTVNLESEDAREKTPVLVASAMRELNAVVGIPLIYRSSLIGILMLGKKKSDEAFTAPEIESLPAVASQVAVALSNARLYDIQRKSQVEFIQQAKMAGTGPVPAPSWVFLGSLLRLGAVLR